LRCRFRGQSGHRPASTHVRKGPTGCVPSGSRGTSAGGEQLRPVDQPRELFADHPQLVCSWVSSKSRLGLGWNQTSSAATVGHDQASLLQGSFSSGTHRTHDIAKSPTAWAARLVRAVLVYRSKFSDRPAGAVPNSYPKLDLLWDNVIAGPWGWPPLNGASASPGPSLRHAAGRDVYHMPPGEFQIEKCNPPMARMSWS